jgi:uncharacterized protein
MSSLHGRSHKSISSIPTLCQTFLMKNLTATICLAVALLLGSAGVSWSQDFQKGLTAYESGDFATALREWTPLAKQGDAAAQYNLGQMYRKGQGVPQDDKTAVKWYRLAAEQGDADAQFNLGVMYDEGRGVPQDHKTAVKWYRLAAEQGDAFAQYNLGLMYEDGTGVPQDDKTAVRWYRLAAEQGDADAQFNLGVMYGKGEGVIQDDVMAHMWFNIATANGSENGAKGRDIAAKNMTPSQDLARECVRKKYKGC